MRLITLQKQAVLVLYAGQLYFCETGSTGLPYAFHWIAKSFEKHDKEIPPSSTNLGITKVQEHTSWWHLSEEKLFLTSKFPVNKSNGGFLFFIIKEIVKFGCSSLCVSSVTARKGFKNGKSHILTFTEKCNKMVVWIKGLFTPGHFMQSDSYQIVKRWGINALWNHSNHFRRWFEMLSRWNRTSVNAFGCWSHICNFYSYQNGKNK